MTQIKPRRKKEREKQKYGNSNFLIKIKTCDFNRNSQFFNLWYFIPYYPTRISFYEADSARYSCLDSLFSLGHASSVCLHLAFILLGKFYSFLFNSGLWGVVVGIFQLTCFSPLGEGALRDENNGSKGGLWLCTNFFVQCMILFSYVNLNAHHSAKPDNYDLRTNNFLWKRKIGKFLARENLKIIFWSTPNSFDSHRKS